MITAERTDERVFAEIQRLCHMGLDSETLTPKVAEALACAVPFDGHAVVTIDPLTGLATDFSFSEEMGDEEDARFFIESIYFEDDVLDYGWMARNRVPAMTLSEATGGRLERALRYREYNGPKGFGPGARAVLTVGERLWGGLCLVRGKDVEDFSEREVAFLRRISPHLGAGLRAATRRSGLRPEPTNDGVEPSFDTMSPATTPASAEVLVLDKSLSGHGLTASPAHDDGDDRPGDDNAGEDQEQADLLGRPIPQV